MKIITILLVDDHTSFRESMGSVLEVNPRFTVVAQINRGEKAVELCKQLRPDIVIMDINLPGINGIEATELITKHSPASKILGVSSHIDFNYAREMIHKGALGYVTKNCSCKELIYAIMEIHEGRQYICTEIKNILTDQLLSEDGLKQGLNKLTPREIGIIQNIKNGNSSKEIAQELNISVKTVEVHRYNILKKLNLKNSAALVNFTSHMPQS